MAEFLPFDDLLPVEDEIVAAPGTSYESVLAASDWTTETVISQLMRGNINVNPTFQRRDAWTTTRKSKFIESLILGLPVPQIVLAELPGKKGRFVVLDGKQRLLTLLQFVGAEGFKDKQFSLRDLDILQELKGMKFDQINNDPLLSDHIVSFFNQPIRATVIRGWTDDRFLHIVFLRLNTGSLPLSPQELRQALLPGKFTEFIDKAAADSGAIRDLLHISRPDFRMRDIELMLRFYAVNFRLDTYAGDLKKFLDETCRYFNGNWDEAEELLQEFALEVENAYQAALQVFKGSVGRKWIGDRYEGRLNRAVLDCQFYFFADPDVRNALAGKEQMIEDEFKSICDTSVDFRAAIEQTTKSVDAVFTRLWIWGEALQKILQSPVRVPQMDNGRIVP